MLTQLNVVRNSKRIETVHLSLIEFWQRAFYVLWFLMYYHHSSRRRVIKYWWTLYLVCFWCLALNKQVYWCRKSFSKFIQPQERPKTHLINKNWNQVLLSCRFSNSNSKSTAFHLFSWPPWLLRKLKSKIESNVPSLTTVTVLLSSWQEFSF